MAGHESANSGSRVPRAIRYAQGCNWGAEMTTVSWGIGVMKLAFPARLFRIRSAFLSALSVALICAATLAAAQQQAQQQAPQQAPQNHVGSQSANPVGSAVGGVARVLWFNAMPDMGTSVRSSHRKKMADYLTSYRNGAAFNVTYTRSTRGGAMAVALNNAPYDIVVLDMGNDRVRMNGADATSLQHFYASGHDNLMLDGTFSIRNITHNQRTRFPGENGAIGGLLVNQIAALAERGGGILIGTDHDNWQLNANKALAALIPGASFSGVTNPSTDGDFIGTILLGQREEIAAIDVLRHWESIPNQGEAPVGEYLDFLGRPVVLYSLVETADKPGGGRKRPYISTNFFPGDDRIPIDSEEKVFENIPTHKSGP